MKLSNIYIVLIVLILAHGGQAQQVAKAENGIFLLKNGTIHAVSSSPTVGDVLLKDGKINDIGTNLKTPEGAIVIDCTNKHIYPGLIDSGCRLGLAEIESISVSNDFSELGEFIPHMKALTAINPNSVAIPITRVNAVTTVFAKPSGNLFPGQGALIDLFGYTPEQMYAGFQGVVLQFPSSGRRGRFDKRSEEEIKKDSEKVLKKLDDIWETATQYVKMDSSARAEKKVLDTNNPQMIALMPIVQGQAPLMIEVNAKNDIELALQWVESKKIKAVLMGVAEGYRVANKISKAKIPVITGPVIEVPGREQDRYDVSYTNPAKMSKAGVKVAIRSNNAENTRNLPFEAGFAAAYGMGTDEALRAVTLTPAEIFGVEDQYGSIQKGKKANVFVSTGDPFETKTKIEYLFIHGWKVPMESRQTLLKDEFLERSPGVK